MTTARASSILPCDTTRGPLRHVCPNGHQLCAPNLRISCFTLGRVATITPPAQLRSDLEAESAERAKRLAAQIAQQREERLRQEVCKITVVTLSHSTARCSWDADDGGAGCRPLQHLPADSTMVLQPGTACWWSGMSMLR